MQGIETYPSLQAAPWTIQHKPQQDPEHQPTRQVSSSGKTHAARPPLSRAGHRAARTGETASPFMTTLPAAALGSRAGERLARHSIPAEITFSVPRWWKKTDLAPLLLNNDLNSAFTPAGSSLVHLISPAAVNKLAQASGLKLLCCKSP